jgi:hypothetical protein
MISSAEFVKKHPVKDLYTYPLHDANAFLELPTKKCLIIPDLHANPILALQYLLRSKIMSWPDNGEQYWQRICDFYREPIPKLDDMEAVTAYLKKFRSEYEDLLQQAEFANSKTLLLLGDMLGDRGVNDWFILLLLAVLNEHGVGFSITFSNHDCETYFWAMMDKFDEEISFGVIANGQRVSLINFNGLYPLCSDRLKKRMRDSYHDAYLPHVVLFAYTFDKKNNTFIIASHAPGSFELLIDTAKEFEIEIPDLNKAANLIKLLDECNNIFHNFLLTNPKKLHDFYSPIASWRIDERDYSALLRAIWGRNFECNQARHTQPNNYKIIWICGHLGSRSHPQRVINLDKSDLGKREFGLNYEFGKRQKPVIDCTQGNLCFGLADPKIGRLDWD